MKRLVALVEFSMYDQYPLVSGYLHAYARADPAVADAFDFTYYSREVGRATYDHTLAEIRALRAQVVCFSCYVWNMGLIKRLVADLSREPSIQAIVLGGHQVSHHIGDYVDRTNDKVIVINGQGEIPFRAVLQRLADSRGRSAQSQQLWGVPGVSVHADGELWNGGEAAMLSDLDAIPSPFLGGHFDQMVYPITIFETNRGCPFKCSFCTWGGDTLKVAKFSTDRIREELLWIAKKQIFFLYLADANWGMLARDVELSEYIARLKADHGCPMMVYYAAAKNKPIGSVACIEKFHDGGVITSQAVGIQSLNAHTLELIDRRNIKTTAFIQMFDELKARSIDAYGELIWPLPGETLDSLQASFEQLLELGAPTVVMYPTILINNARLTTQAAEHEFETITAAEWQSELRVVKSTKWVDRSQVDEGFWFYYAWFLLANCDRAKALLRYLRGVTGKRYAALASEFSAYLRANIPTSRYAGLIESIFQKDEHGSLLTIGRLATNLTYQERLAAQRDVSTFVIETQLPGDPARGLAISTLWALALPKLFTGTPDDQMNLVAHLNDLGRAGGQTLDRLASVGGGGDGRVIEVQFHDRLEIWREVAEHFAGTLQVDDVARLEIRHPRPACAYQRRDENKNYVYAHGMIQRLNHIAPSITAGYTPAGVFS